MARRTIARVITFLLALVGSPRLAVAQSISAPVSLDWIAPPGCPSAADVEIASMRLLGSSPVASSTVVVRVEVRSSASDHWFASLTISTGSATRARAFEGRSCRSIADATALVVAFSVDPIAAVRASLHTAPVNRPPRAVARPAPSPVPPGSSVPPPEETIDVAAEPLSAPIVVAAGPLAAPILVPAETHPQSPTRVREITSFAREAPMALPQRPRRPRHGIDVRAGVFVSVDGATLPTPAPGISGEIGLAYARLRLMLDVRYVFPQSQFLASPVGAGGAFDLIALSLASCVALSTGRIEVAPCSGLEAGVMRGTGFGITSPGHAEAFWLAPSFGGQIAIAIVAHFALAANVAVSLPILRPDFDVDNLAPTVFQTSPVTVRAAIGALWYF